MDLDRRQLLAVARRLAPHLGAVERHFRRTLRSNWSAKQRKALVQMTPVAALRLLLAGGRLAQFFEQVEYNGRRLVKLETPPLAVVRILKTCTRMLETLAPDGGVLQRLNFCTVTALNDCYYGVREEEAEAFYALFRAEVGAE